MSLTGLATLDLGCGEGTNAAWLMAQQCSVTAVDISEHALINARRKYPESKVNWLQADATELQFPDSSFDLIVAYGLLHCIQDGALRNLVWRMQRWTKPSGINVVVAFNARSQDLSGHPGFEPTLLTHDMYMHLYGSWETLLSTDTDLYETHPHNGIPHHHSMTRLAAKKPSR
jgi:ubiquinone/menaquinone biosynthesis C-methylase UbiE